MTNYICGLLFGQIIGDALGTRYEFTFSDESKKMIFDDIKNSKNGKLNILGGGVFKVKPGQVTDDTELAFGLLYSILQNKTYNKEDVANKYLEWYNSNPFDIGRTTKIAMSGSVTYKNMVQIGRASCRERV